MASCVVICGLTCLVLAFLLCAVSFSAPYWIMYKQPTETNIVSTELSTKTPATVQEKVINVGLIAACEDNSCTWHFENSFENLKNEMTWMHATQGLFALGIVTCIVAFIVAISNIVCKACSESACVLVTVGILMLLMFLEVAAAICLYGYYKRDLGLTKENKLQFSWAFFLGMGGALCSLLSAIFYFVESRRLDPHQYERAHAI